MIMLQHLILDVHLLLYFSIMSRVQRTLHGSSDDIGWLQYNPDMAPVEDGTSRFLEILEAIRYLIFIIFILFLLQA